MSKFKIWKAWLGTYRSIPWPPRSPDLSSLDFFLWGHLQSIVYAVSIQNMEHLKQRIRTTCEIHRDSIIGATNGNLLYRAELCQENGLQFEHLL